MEEPEWNGRFAPTSNVACRKAIVAAVPFDETYGKLGAEDRDWFVRVADAGWEIVFEPEAAVLHFPDLRGAAFLLRHFRYGRGAFRFRQRHHSGKLGPSRFYARLVRRGFAEGPAVGALVAMAQLATAAGYAAEAVASARREKSGSSTASRP
jgi:GT2 family glycosyltransferase